MENNVYFIPANSKNSMLILGLFNVVDLIIFGTGILITFIFLLVMPKDTMGQLLFVISPGLIASFLVLPFPNHHNMRTLIKNVYNYFTNRKRYYWKGWCINYGKK